MCPRPPEPGTLQPLSSLVPLPVGPFYPRDPLCPSVVKDFSTQCVPGRLSQEPFNPILLRARGDGTVLPRDPLCPSVVKDFPMQCVPGRLSQEPFNPVLLRAPFVPLVIGPSYPVILCVPLWSRVFRCNVSQAA